jgi:hypothetical protein
MKRVFNILIFTILGFSVFFIFSCTEKIELKTESFENVLVVEATITDELKYHEIKISRTYPLEGLPTYENNAVVKIEDSNQNVYNFHGAGNGLYVSDIQFQAVGEVSYKLIINTQDGKQYISNEELLPPKVDLKNLYAELIDLNGNVGVQVFVDTNDNLGEAIFFRYTYEETYKVVAPYYSATDAVISNINYLPTGSISYDIDFVDRPLEQKICYSKNSPYEIILTNTNGLSEDKISRFPIRFISQDNAILRDRYSILVKQYVQSPNANNYYKILKELSGDASLLLDPQPGYIQGNIISQQSNKEKVIGYFDVSSVSSKRIYFNYQDFNISRMPPYFYNCDYRTVSDSYDVFVYLELYKYKYIRHVEPEYDIVARPCGDCTYFSSSVKPDFWEE